MELNAKCKIRILNLVQMNKKLKDALEEMGKSTLISNIENISGRGDSSDALRNLNVP